MTLHTIPIAREAAEATAPFSPLPSVVASRPAIRAQRPPARVSPKMGRRFSRAVLSLAAMLSLALAVLVLVLWIRSASGTTDGVYVRRFQRPDHFDSARLAVQSSKGRLIFEWTSRRLPEGIGSATGTLPWHTGWSIESIRDNDLPIERRAPLYSFNDRLQREWLYHNAGLVIADWCLFLGLLIPPVAFVVHRLALRASPSATARPPLGFEPVFVGITPMKRH